MNIPVKHTTTVHKPVWFYMEAPTKHISIWEWYLAATQGEEPPTKEYDFSPEELV